MAKLTQEQMMGTFSALTLTTAALFGRRLRAVTFQPTSALRLYCGPLPQLSGTLSTWAHWTLMYTALMPITAPSFGRTRLMDVLRPLPLSSTEQFTLLQKSRSQAPF